ncbi:uncharacterized protein [Cherax quadricarinatus]
MEQTLSDIKQNAQKLHKSGRFKEAEDLFSEVLRLMESSGLDPNTLPLRKEQIALVYNDRGQCRYMQVYFDEAVTDYTEAIKLDPTLAVAYYNRGTIYYRLCAGMPQETGEMQSYLQKALDDLEEALKLAPDNLEFLEGLKNCKAILLTKDKIKVLKLKTTPLGKLAKLLFLLDNGDRSTGATEEFQEQNTEAAQEAKNVFLSILKDKEKGHHQIINILLKRGEQCRDYPTLALPSGTASSSRGLRKADEDLLTLTQACHYLGIEYQCLDEKLKKVQDKALLTQDERNGTFFIYAENLFMIHMCDSLTPTLVFKLLNIMKTNKSFSSGIDKDLLASITIDQLTHEGLKEALFFFIIRLMEDGNMLNRLYTDKLKDAFKELNQNSTKEEKQIITSLLYKLRNYPGECHPSGLCIVFCVSENREGASSEIAKIKKLFENILGFTVKIEENPSVKTIESYELELQKPKYRYYDSIVYWFVSHGNETELKLPNDEIYLREEFIDNFSKPANFIKKPKIFFMAACRGEKTIPVVKKGGRPSSADAKHRANIKIPDSSLDIENVHYEVDRLVVNATLPTRYSFRSKDEGSVFVDVVCSLLEEYCGENITEALVEASRIIHQIIFKSNDNSFEGFSKQACSYDSTLQKTFIIPVGKKKQ